MVNAYITIYSFIKGENVAKCMTELYRDVFGSNMECEEILFQMESNIVYIDMFSKIRQHILRLTEGV